MSDLTLDEFRDLTEAELKKLLAEEARMIFAPTSREKGLLEATEDLISSRPEFDLAKCGS